MDSTIWLWLGFAGFVLVLLAFDLGLLHRKQRETGIIRFHSLKYGLPLTLVFVGAKMVLVDIWKVPTTLALADTSAA